MRVRFLVDGFNLYHSLKDAGHERDKAVGTSGCRGTRWFDIPRACREFINNNCGREAKVEKILYFTAYATHLQNTDAQRIDRHKQYIACLRHFGVETILGRFKKAGRPGDTRYEEKETDVAIGVHLMAALATDACDMAVIVSGDTDLVPALRVAKQTFPDKKLGVMFPYRRAREELAQLADAQMRISQGMCFQFQLPDPPIDPNGAPVVGPDGSLIRKPEKW